MQDTLEALDINHCKELCSNSTTIECNWVSFDPSNKFSCLLTNACDELNEDECAGCCARTNRCLILLCIIWLVYRLSSSLRHSSSYSSKTVI